MHRSALGLVVLLCACSGPGQTPATPDPVAVLREAGSAMSAVKTVAADVKFGSGVVLQGLTLQSATSRIALPADSDSTFKVKQGDFLVDVQVVTVGGQVFLKLPFSKFAALPPGEAAIASLIAARTSMRSTLRCLVARPGANAA